MARYTAILLSILFTLTHSLGMGMITVDPGDVVCGCCPCGEANCCEMAPSSGAPQNETSPGLPPHSNGLVQDQIWLISPGILVSTISFPELPFDRTDRFSHFRTSPTPLFQRDCAYLI